VNYCAAVSAQDSGDARKALDLLRIAADIAERNGDTCVTSAHVDYARQKIELDAVSEVIRTLTDQSKIILKSIIISPKNDEGFLTTGEVYATYMNIATQLACPVISQRRVADLISELDMLGIINARVKSFGRRGRTKEIEINVSNDILSILDHDELFEGLVIKSGKQMTFDSQFE
jgi:cell division control protein 6